MGKIKLKSEAKAFSWKRVRNMLFGLLFAASMIFLQPIECEAEYYLQNTHKTGEYIDGSAKIIELNNGVTFRFREKDSTLMRFDLSAGGMSYGNLTIGKEINKSNDYIANYKHGDGTISYINKFEDNSLLLISTKDGIVRKISRLSKELTQA